MATVPAGTFQNLENCEHYAGFMGHLEGHHFAAMYWSFFFVVIFMLFVTAAIFQWAMARREEHENGELDDRYFRRRWITAMLIALSIFLITAVFCIMEVFALMALQFCQGEPLISLYWSSWMMLQLGSEVAILGIVLAMWLHLQGIDHPKWALALGTPVLVVAGFGHVFTHLAEKRLKKIADRRSERGLSIFSRSPSIAKPIMEGDGNFTSAAPSIRHEQSPSDNEQEKKRPSASPSLPPSPSRLEAGCCDQPAAAYFMLDTGDDERVRAWPAFVGMSEDGKAVLQLTPVPAFNQGNASPARTAAGNT
ncbi:hypothetical protein Micbo1qcDRAFT_175041 [Microdochium bolleyi]|uniref:Uncharacterized protein n=1 Tax=Microdochium bolleyi TaxID=196109 RepID=A0A136J4L0_9PEZI|nr:hypothetical protein Micbo1qcDRAFT_175041 [Microdochium bolleyi]